VENRIDGNLTFLRDSLDLVIHSTDRPLETLGILDLPYETFHTTMQPEGFVAPAYATRKGNGQVFVIVSIREESPGVFLFF
jgi:hypothetical protein